LAFADVVLLNKTDLVTPVELATLERTIRSINPTAKIHRTERSSIALDQILDRGAFDLNRVLENDPHFLDAHDDDHHHHDHDHDHDDPNHVHDENCGHHHHHDHDHDHPHGEISAVHDLAVKSISLRGGAMQAEKFLQWINDVTQIDGPDILRLKGIIAFANDNDRYVVQGVHMIVEGDHQRPWRDDEKRESRLVFIGRNLDVPRLTAGFESCAA
jgi:G3E family GTPase